jgi:RNA polymerase sigma-70 factor, ECF subfamily
MPAPGPLPDSSSVQRAEEFAGLFGRHARQIYAYILTLVPHWADAEDVFQDTSLILWEKFGEFATGTNFRAWACQVAYYRVIRFRQQQKKLAVPLSEEFLRLIAAETLSQHDLLEDRHLALAICMQRIPAVDRDLIDRCYVPGVTIKQVAVELGRSPETTYKTLKRIHRELFECVEAKLHEKD